MAAVRWLLAPRAPEAETALCRELGMTPRLAKLLVNRGIKEPAAAADFLEARLSRQLRSPMLFRDMPAAAARVTEAIRRRERIGIFGDFDADGISGTALLVSFFRALGTEPAVYIPHRVRDGYGLNDRGIRALAEQDVRLMITVDCGGAAHGEIGRARQSGIDVVVCDHHQVAGRALPACAVLNPIEPESGFPFSGLCGAGVSFYLVLGTRMRLRAEGWERLPDARRLLDLVALGTVGDIVPMLEENRVLVKYGLQEIARTTRPGLVALKEVSGVTNISTGVVGFRLAPRLNAGGRLGDASQGVELLTTADEQRARQLAAEMDRDNKARQSIENEILQAALRQIEDDADFVRRRAIVLASPHWHPGVIGIVASRLVERFYRPSILVAINAETGMGRGSCRGIRGLHLYRALERCADVLENFGGHQMAAGFSIRADNIAMLAQRFEEEVRAATGAEDFVPRTEVDDEVRLEEIDDPLLADLNRLEPFGPGNPEPLFFSRGLTILSRRIVGESHLRLSLAQDDRRFGAIAFGMAETPLREGDIVDTLAIPERDHWNGGIRLRVKQMRRAARQP